jgi:hypothetical protein
MEALIQPGTPCLVRSRSAPQHNGKVVVVDKYDGKLDSYECSPTLQVSVGGPRITWAREALIPLPGGDGTDEMVRKTGKPKRSAARLKPATVPDAGRQIAPAQAARSAVLLSIEDRLSCLETTLRVSLNMLQQLKESR